MLHNYNSYTLILEGKARDKKIKKVKEKIKKFANLSCIYDWSIEKCTSDRSTEGLQYAVWVANHLKYVVVNAIKETAIYYIKDLTNKRIEDYIKNGKDSDKELEEAIVKDWNDEGVENVVVGMQEHLNDNVNYVLDWLKSPLRDEKFNLGELTFDDAYDKSKTWHNSLKATGKVVDETGEIFIEFDDGSYWIDLQTTNSEDEANAMGHCGVTNDGDTLLSFRDKNKSPHVTVAFGSSDGAIYQMKGRNNKKPVEKYHKYIYRLLVDPELKPKYFAYEYLKEEDFNMSDFNKETFDKVYNYNPNLVYQSIQYDTKMCRGLLEKGFLNKDDIKDVMTNSHGVSVELFLDLISEYDGDGSVNVSLFTNDELKEIYKNSIFDFGKYGELPPLIFYRDGFMSNEEFVEVFTELSIGENGNLYIELDEDDLEPVMSDFVCGVMFDDLVDLDFGGDNDMENSNSVWSDLTKETKKMVINKMI